MSVWTQALRARLHELGMPFEGEQLARAEALVRNAGVEPHVLDDLTLMTVAGEAYRQPDRLLIEVV